MNKELAPVREELLRSGIQPSKSDAIHFLHQSDYPAGIPIIFKHLRMPYSDVTKAYIAEALIFTRNKFIREAWPEIAEIYVSTPNKARNFGDTSLPFGDSYAKLILANALVRAYEPRRFGALLKLTEERKNGETRIILLQPLLRVRNRRPGAMEALRNLLGDPELQKELVARGVS